MNNTQLIGAIIIIGLPCMIMIIIAIALFGKKDGIKIIGITLLIVAIAGLGAYCLTNGK